jgi:hypothetical protein
MLLLSMPKVFPPICVVQLERHRRPHDRIDVGLHDLADGAVHQFVV